LLACGEAINQGNAKTVFWGPNLGAMWGAGSCHIDRPAWGPVGYALADSQSSLLALQHREVTSRGRDEKEEAPSYPIDIPDLFLG